eukprot:2259051-Amphidinium_carterae.1
MRPIISFLEEARACALTIRVSGPNGAQLLWQKLVIESPKFDGMILEGPLERQCATADELQAMHNGELIDTLDLDKLKVNLLQEVKETEGVGDVRTEKLWHNDASGVWSVLQKQRPTWVLVLTHGFRNPFTGYGAFCKEGGLNA